MLFGAVLSIQFVLFAVFTSMYLLEFSKSALRSMAQAAAAADDSPSELLAAARAYEEESLRRGRLLRRLAPDGEKHFAEDGSPLRKGLFHFMDMTPTEERKLLEKEVEKALNEAKN